MQKVLKKYDNFSEEYFSNKEKNAKFYDELFQNADKYLGEIFQHFKFLGLDEDTLLVVISDHGISTGEKFGERAYGVFCYDTTLISTALFYSPSISPLILKNQVRSIDILPTILEYLSIPLDDTFAKMDGESLVPIINGKKESRISFSQSGNPLNSEQPPKEPNVYAVRTDDWKYIKNIYNNTEELYDLSTDPDETTNLIDLKIDKADQLRLEMNNILNS
jgi:arylsulfatase A-like enzyme